MGLQTNITILNDAIGEIKKNPVEFVDKIIENMNRVSSKGVCEFGIGCYANGMTVNSSEHSITTTILAVGGNYTTVLGKVYNGGVHHTDESQVKILKDLANNLGYELVKK